MKPQTTTDLNAMHCNCGATHSGDHEPFYLNSRCHTGSGVFALYRGDGVLELVCAVCEKPVAAIAVASEAP